VDISASEPASSSLVPSIAQMQRSIGQLIDRLQRYLEISDAMFAERLLANCTFCMVCNRILEPLPEAQGRGSNATRSLPMFFRTNHLQFDAKPERPDPAFARMLQEPLGGQWGEISVMMTYLFQGWNCRGPAKYKDMTL
jgi:hypothetical protein